MTPQPLYFMPHATMLDCPHFSLWYLVTVKHLRVERKEEKLEEEEEEENTVLFLDDSTIPLHDFK
jgi:hypothetical protein